MAGRAVTAGGKAGVAWWGAGARHFPAGFGLALLLAPCATGAAEPAWQGRGPALPPPLVLALARGGMAAVAPPSGEQAGIGAAAFPLAMPAGTDHSPIPAFDTAAPAGGVAGSPLASMPTAAPGDAAPGDGLAGPAVPGGAMHKVRLSRAVGAGVILAWGLARWDYGEQSLHSRSEGWFGRDTPEGGADKAGHLYTGYVAARGLAALYRDWGLDGAAAARQGALSSLLLTTAMELGDGFSPYGVSGEDVAMNVAGAWAGLLLARHEAWRERVDLRVEYRFNSGAADPVTDYGHARFLVALKPAGFQAWRDTPLRWLELQAGYYARGYDDPRAARQRTLYAGLGLNLPLLLRRAGQERVATFLQFYQPPDSSLRLERDL